MSKKSLKVDRDKFEGIVKRLLQSDPVKREDVKPDKKKPAKLIEESNMMIRESRKMAAKTRELAKRTQTVVRESQKSLEHEPIRPELPKKPAKLIPPQKT